MGGLGFGRYVGRAGGRLGDSRELGEMGRRRGGPSWSLCSAVGREEDRQGKVCQ